MNILLVERRTHQDRVSLALTKLSTLHKRQGDKVVHAILDGEYVYPQSFIPDKIYISLVFSWDLPYVAKFIHKIKCLNTNLDEFGHVVLGGIPSTFMDEKLIRQYLGNNVAIEKGCSAYLDSIIPDHSMFRDDCSYLFTKRGCPNNCSFCAVPKLEPDGRIIENWKEHIDMTKKNIVIMDNNILSEASQRDRTHKFEVFSYLKGIAPEKGCKVQGSRKIRTVEFDSGLDWKLLHDENLELIRGIKYSKLKFAWDKIEYEQGFDRAMKNLLSIYPIENANKLRDNMECYVLYNCPDTKDTIEDTLYRCYKLYYHYRVLPYLMRYQPLDTLTYKTYVSPLWNELDAIDVGRWVNSRRVYKVTPRYLYYYGRDDDNKCINKFNEIQLSAITSIKNKIHSPLKLDFSKSYKENYNFIREELLQREDMMHRFKEEVKHTQLSLLNPI